MSTLEAMTSNTTPEQAEALARFLETVYQRLKAEKISEVCPPEIRGEYDRALTALAESGAELSELTLWGICTVDVLYEGSGESFTYRGVLLQDQRGIELVTNTGDIAADYLTALLRCFGTVEPGASVYQSAARSGGRVIVVEDPVFGSVLAYAVKCGELRGGK